MNLTCPICYEKYDGKKIKPVTLLPCQHTICSNCHVNFGGTEYFLDLFENNFVNKKMELVSFKNFLKLIKIRGNVFNCKFKKCPFCQKKIYFKILNHAAQILFLKGNFQNCENENCKEFIDENFLINFFNFEKTKIFCSLKCSGYKACSPNKVPNCFSYFLTDISKNLVLLEKIFEIFQDQIFANIKKKIRKRTKIRKVRLTNMNFNKNFTLMNLIYGENEKKFMGLEKFTKTNLNLVKIKVLEDYEKIKNKILKFSKTSKILEKKKKKEINDFKQKNKVYYSDSKINYAFYRFVNKNMLHFKKFFSENENIIEKKNSEYFFRINNLKKFILFNKTVTRYFKGIIGQYIDFLNFKINKLNENLKFCNINSKNKILKRIKFYKKNLEIEISDIFENIEFNLDYKNKLDFTNISEEEEKNYQIKNKNFVNKKKKISKKKNSFVEMLKDIIIDETSKEINIDEIVKDNSEKYFFKNSSNSSIDLTIEQIPHDSIFDDLNSFNKKRNFNNSISNDEGIINGPQFRNDHF